MDKNAYVVILAGGSGERFWPLSTKARPKQFVTLFGGKALLTQAVERVSPLIPPDRIFIITAERLVPDTIAAATGVPRRNIVGEPCKRDTAAAIAVACGMVRQLNPDGIVCILTADQLMGEVDIFRRTLADAVAVAANHDAIVTIGIKPTYPATTFGYIETGDAVPADLPTCFNRALRFVEKPDAGTAAGYVASGKYFWNAGMFIWKASVMRSALAEHAPDLAALSDRVAELDGLDPIPGLLREAYPPLRAISIDYAVMEHVKNIIMARGEFGWDDVGSWTAVAEHFPADDNGNVAVGECVPLDSRNNIMVSEGRLTALIGVSDLVVVNTANATLVCPRNQLGQLKQLVGKIASRPDGEKFV